MRSHLKKRWLIPLAITAAATFGIPLVTSAPAMAADRGTVTVCNYGGYFLYWDVRAANGTMIGGGNSSDLANNDCRMTSLFPAQDGTEAQVYLIPRTAIVNPNGYTFHASTNSATSYKCYGVTVNWSCYSS